MLLIGFVVNQLIDIYIFILIITAVLSWLVAFDVLNSQTPAVQKILAFCSALTEPALNPIRKVVPPFQGIDLSPIILFVFLTTFKYFLNTYIF